MGVGAWTGKWRVEGEKLRVWQFTTLPKVDLLNGVTDGRMEETTLSLTPGAASWPWFWVYYPLFAWLLPYMKGGWLWIGLIAFFLAIVWILRWEAGVEKLSLRSFVSSEIANSMRRKENWSTAVGMGVMILMIGGDWLDAISRGGRCAVVFGIIVTFWWFSRPRLKCRKAGTDASGRSQFLVTGIHPDALRYLARHESGKERVSESSAFGS
jgi:hypothetical protein